MSLTQSDPDIVLSPDTCVASTEVIEIEQPLSHLAGMTSVLLNRYIVKRVDVDNALRQKAKRNWDELGPALMEMERRYNKVPGARTDIHDLAVPGWHEYLTSRGVNPNTYRSWKHRNFSLGLGRVTTPRSLSNPAQATAAKNLADARANLGAAAASGNEQAASIIAGYQAEYDQTVTATPVALIEQPNINVIAAELTRDLESDSRMTKLASVVAAGEYLNPTLIGKLRLALANAAKNYTDAAAVLSASMPVASEDGKCHQRVVRERMALLPDADLEEKRMLAVDFKNAIVREASFEEAAQLILENEYLGNTGSAVYWVGLFLRNPDTGREFLAGVTGFGSTAGTHVAPSVCGPENKDRVLTIVRGACVHWAHPHSASHLLPKACDLMAKRDYNVFIAYSDPAANEVGTVYQASNFKYCGMTKPTEKYRTPDGKVHDGRMISGLTRDRRNGGLRYKWTRTEQKAILERQGCVFFRGNAKHRYVHIAAPGNKRLKRELLKSLRWPKLETYPKRTYNDNH